jgi:hypothetical protein
MTKPANTGHEVREVSPESDHHGRFLHAVDRKGIRGSKANDGYHRRSIFESMVYGLNQLGDSPCLSTLNWQVDQEEVTQNEYLLRGDGKQDINWQITRRRGKLKAARLLSQLLRKLGHRQRHHPLQGRASLPHREETAQLQKGALQGPRQGYCAPPHLVHLGQSYNFKAVTLGARWPSCARCKTTDPQTNQIR